MRNCATTSKNIGNYGTFNSVLFYLSGKDVKHSTVEMQPRKKRNGEEAL